MDRRDFIKKGLLYVAATAPIVSPVIARAFCAPVITPFTSIPASSCEQTSGTTILGFSAVGGNWDNVTADMLKISRFQALYDCSIDTIHTYIHTSFTSPEQSTFGIYSDSGTLLGNTGGITGDGLTPAWYSDTMTAVGLTGGVYYWLAHHADATVSTRDQNAGAGSGVKKFDAVYTYSHGTLPASIDTTGYLAGYEQSIYATNP